MQSYPVMIGTVGSARHARPGTSKEAWMCDVQQIPDPRSVVCPVPTASVRGEVFAHGRLYSFFLLCECLL